MKVVTFSLGDKPCFPITDWTFNLGSASGENTLALLNFSQVCVRLFGVFFTANLDEAMSCTDEKHWIHDLNHRLIAARVSLSVMTAV